MEKGKKIVSADPPFVPCGHTVRRHLALSGKYVLQAETGPDTGFPSPSTEYQREPYTNHCLCFKVFLNPGRHCQYWGSNLLLA